MKIERIWNVYFSPAGSTKKIIGILSEDIGRKLGVSVENFDYTMPESRQKTKEFQRGDLILWGTPVYAGRIPNKTLSYVQNAFQGNGSLAVPVVVFGNRNFDDALVELRNELESNGFHTVAAAAVAARHCFSNRLAAGRPDEKDIQKLHEFADCLVRKIKELSETAVLDKWEPVKVPGTNPPDHYYTPKGLDNKPAVFLKAVPKVDEKRCIHCGLCSEFCPMGSIHIPEEKDKGLPVVEGICIKCQACILKCPKGAFYFDDPAFLSHKAMLERDFMRRSEPEFFLNQPMKQNQKDR